MFASLIGTAVQAGGTAQMHAPDGFLSLPVAAVMWVLTLIVHRGSR